MCSRRHSHAFHSSIRADVQYVWYIVNILSSRMKSTCRNRLFDVLLSFSAITSQAQKGSSSNVRGVWTGHSRTVVTKILPKILPSYYDFSFCSLHISLADPAQHIARCSGLRPTMTCPWHWLAVGKSALRGVWPPSFAALYEGKADNDPATYYPGTGLLFSMFCPSPIRQQHCSSSSSSRSPPLPCAASSLVTCMRKGTNS